MDWRWVSDYPLPFAKFLRVGIFSIQREAVKEKYAQLPRVWRKN
jgi:hypothetical protein